MLYVDPALRGTVREFLKIPHLVLERGRKHTRVRNTLTGDWLPVPGSSGDRNAVRHLRVGLSVLAAHGRGFIFAKTGHLPVSNFGVGGV